MDLLYTLYPQKVVAQVKDTSLEESLLGSEKELLHLNDDPVSVVAFIGKSSYLENRSHLLESVTGPDVKWKTLAEDDHVAFWSDPSR